MFCKNCFAPNLIKCGFEKGRQRYECNVCGHKSVYVIENLELMAPVSAYGNIAS